MARSWYWFLVFLFLYRIGRSKKEVSVAVDYSLKLSLVGKALLIEGDVLVEVEQSECIHTKKKN